MRTYFSFEGGGYVFEDVICVFEDVMLPILVFFGIFTFAKVERWQVIESCGISWEDSVMVELI